MDNAQPVTTFDLSAPTNDVLTELTGDAWRGAVLLYAGMGLSAAAGKAGVEASEFEFALHQGDWTDYVGLRTSCERTAKWLAAWLGHNVQDRARDGDGNSLRPYVMSTTLPRTVEDIRAGTTRTEYLAVYASYKVSD